jgi:hypothetical protein
LDAALIERTAPASRQGGGAPMPTAENNETAIPRFRRTVVEAAE